MCKLHITRNGFSFFYDVLCFFRKRILRDTIFVFLILLARIYIHHTISYIIPAYFKYFIKNILLFYITFSRFGKFVTRASTYFSLFLSLSLFNFTLYVLFYNFFCCVFFGEFKNSSARFTIRRISVLVEIPAVRAVNLHNPNLRGNS